jgi:ribosomal protein S18 acetylase RimI-like enzyme
MTEKISMSTQVSIERAELRHIAQIAPLFDAYRRFYGQVDDPRARSFLEERVSRQESVVFLARLEGAAIGFCQLMLQTAVTNLPAQRLYEREGWVRDDDFYVYECHLPQPSTPGVSAARV